VRAYAFCAGDRRRCDQDHIASVIHGTNASGNSM
jgi:hypothetical protein